MQPFIASDAYRKTREYQLSLHEVGEQYWETVSQTIFTKINEACNKGKYSIVFDYHTYASSDFHIDYKLKRSVLYEGLRELGYKVSESGSSYRIYIDWSER